MKLRMLIPVLVVVLAGFLALFALEWRHGLGAFAENPQRLELPLAAWEIVGGRARLGFERLRDDRAALMLQCADGETAFVLRPGETSETLCGVRVRLAGILLGAGLEPTRAVVVVSWEE